MWMKKQCKLCLHSELTLVASPGHCAEGGVGGGGSESVAKTFRCSTVFLLKPLSSAKVLVQPRKKGESDHKIQTHSVLIGVWEPPGGDRGKAQVRPQHRPRT